MITKHPLLSRYFAKVPSRADWIVPFLIAALSGLGTFYMASRNDKVAAQTERIHHSEDMDSRVLVIEQHQKEQDAHISHIEQQVDRLVQWALGSK